MSKGDWRRPGDREAFEANFDRVFSPPPACQCGDCPECHGDTVADDIVANLRTEVAAFRKAFNARCADIANLERVVERLKDELTMAQREVEYWRNKCDDLNDNVYLVPPNGEVIN